MTMNQQLEPPQLRILIVEDDPMMRVALKQSVIDQLKPPRLSNKPTPAIGPGTLSDRELEVLRLIVEGYTNPEIAKSLYLSEHTVKTYVRGILNKLLVNDRVQAAVMALRSGLMS